MQGWSPWHGCHKVSPGCKHCYVYRRDESFGKDASIVYKTKSFALPIQKKRDGSYKLQPDGSEIATCFTSDFFVEEADEWRKDAWAMIKARPDLDFYFITKRPERFYYALPDDWGSGYPNVRISCTVENQAMAEKRLPVFKALPIVHKSIVCEPLLESIDLTGFLGEWVEYVTVGGESGSGARVCDYAWVLAIREQCMDFAIPFYYHQTGSKLRKDGKVYTIPRGHHHAQAKKAKISFIPSKD